MRGGAHILVLAAVVALAGIAKAGDASSSVCVVAGAGAGLDRWADEALRTELAKLLRDTGYVVAAAGSGCMPGGERSIRLAVLAEPRDGDPGDALGSARLVRSEAGAAAAVVAPDVAVFVSPVARLIGTRLSGVLGKALARVAAHEILGHYRMQRVGHAHRTGELVGAERVTGAQLLAAGTR